MTTTDVTRANRLELEVLALRAENADLRAQLAAVMEPFKDDSPWSNGRWSGPKRCGRSETPATIVGDIMRDGQPRPDLVPVPDGA